MNKRRPLTPDEIRRIRDLRADGLPDYEIAAKTRRSRRQVRNALNVSTEQRKVAPRTEDAHEPATITGVQPGEPVDTAALWQAAIQAQDMTFTLMHRKRTQRIGIPTNKPVLLAMVSDQHIGDPGVDYRAMRRDAELIRDTPGVYCMNLGDLWNNWIIGKLMALQRGEALPFDASIQLGLDYLGILHDKLIAWCIGNHDAWTVATAGIDPIEQALEGVECLYDRSELVFALDYAGRTIVIKARHKWPGRSIHNSTHAVESGWWRGDVDFDWGIAADAHTVTTCRQFWRHDKLRSAIQLATYKKADRYARELNLPSPKGTGCGAMLLQPGKDDIWYNHLDEAIEYLTYLRQRAA